MKEEESDLLKTGLNDSSLPTSIPFMTRKDSSRNDFAPFSASAKKSQSLLIIEDEVPQILMDDKYEKIYQQIYSDTRRASKFRKLEEENRVKKIVKRSISHVLECSDKKLKFGQRFSATAQIRSKTTKILKKNMHLGFTQEQKETQTRKSFFRDYRQVMNLQQQCMLLEYYLKDQEKTKTDVSYLKNTSQTSRHRRLTPNQIDIFNLYKTHNEGDYRSLKKRVHLKEQFVQKCCEIAKKNSTYRRKQNFKQIEFILKQNNKNVMEETIVNEYDEQEQLRLIENNKFIKLYLKFALMNQHLRVYYNYITQDGIKKLKIDLFKINPQYQCKEGEVDLIFNRIIQFKNRKVLQFQDFKEMIYSLNQLYAINVIALFYKQRPEYFSQKSEQIIKTHETQIERFMSNHKIQFLLKVLFNTFPEKLVAKKILPIKCIPNIFKYYGFSQKDISISKLFYNYHWVQQLNAGLTFQQFYKGSILMAMKDQDWKGIDFLLKKVNLRKFL